MGKSSKRRNVKKERAFKVTVAIIFWFAVFFTINLITKRNQPSGAVVDTVETYIALAVSAIISLFGFVATIYAIFYLERYSIQGQKKRRR